MNTGMEGNGNSSGEGTATVITGWGAVSPAGWSASALADAVLAGNALPCVTSRRAPDAPERRTRVVPPDPDPASGPKHPRLRRTTTTARYAVHAVWEALGSERVQAIQSGQRRLGTIFCTMNGCVQFSRRFFGEVLENPALASPILFPETVHNSPASHLAALLGSTEINYTLVGDSAQFMAGLDLAAQWLEQDLVDLALVVAAEELDWLSDEALLLFAEAACSAEGAAAVVVERAGSEMRQPSIGITALQEATYGARLSRNAAASHVRQALAPAANGSTLLCDGLGNGPRVDQAEAAAWQDWPGRRLSLKSLIGEGFTVSSGWQTALACECLARGEAQSAVVSAVGNTAQAWGLTLKQ